MMVTQQHISSETPMGGNLVDGGATFRVWAPRAQGAFVCGDFNDWARDDSSRLINNGGRWGGFVPNAKEGQRYKFYVVGAGSSGLKRDPYARDLTNVWPIALCFGGR